MLNSEIKETCMDDMNGSTSETSYVMIQARVIAVELCFLELH